MVCRSSKGLSHRSSDALLAIIGACSFVAAVTAVVGTHVALLQIET